MGETFNFEIDTEFQTYGNQENECQVRYCLIVDGEDRDVVDEKFTTIEDLQKIEDDWETKVNALVISVAPIVIVISYQDERNVLGPDTIFGDVRILVGIAGGSFALCCLFMFIMWRGRMKIYEEHFTNSQTELEMQSAAKSIYMPDTQSHIRGNSELPPGTEKRDKYRLASPQGKGKVLHLGVSDPEDEIPYLSYDPAGTMRQDSRREGEGAPIYGTQDDQELGATHPYSDGDANDIVRPSTVHGRTGPHKVGEADEDNAFNRKKGTDREDEALFLPGDEQRGRATSDEAYGGTASPDPDAGPSPPADAFSIGEAPMSPEIRRPSDDGDPPRPRNQSRNSAHHKTMGQMKAQGFYDGAEKGGTAGNKL